jgi:hypothetical protein
MRGPLQVHPLVRLLRWGWLGVLAPFAAAAGMIVPLTVTEDAGLGRAPGHVTSGVPFPMGRLKSDQQLRLLDEQGHEVPLQTQAAATWRDGSVKWVLLDFQAQAPAGGQRRFQLEVGDGVNRAGGPTGLEVLEGNEELRVSTGPVRVFIPKMRGEILREVWFDANGDGTFADTEKKAAAGLQLSLLLDREWAALKPVVLPPEQVRVEEAGPLRAVVRLGGWIGDGSTNRLFRYDARVQAAAGLAQVRVYCTLTELADRKGIVWVRDLSLTLRQGLSRRQVILGGQPVAHATALEAGQRLTLAQLQEGRYSLSNVSGTVGQGFRAPGWVETAQEGMGLWMGCRHFWQQFPKAITVEADSIRFGLYPREAAGPLDWDQGLAKTHELVLEFHAGASTAEQGAARAAALDHPLLAVAPASWYCDSKVFGDLLPYDFDLFPDYETLTEASGDQFVKRMSTGWRHWGDVYYGGEYKGTNSYTNLEYDMHHNFLCQFARTGLRKYLEPALVMARHQADIDTNHKTGWAWKHSPRHVEMQAEFGHTFTRGLLEAYYLSGERRNLEVAQELGDYFAKEIRQPRSTGNERQIGWALISLLPVFEATWAPRYFEAASNTVERLLAGLDAKGKFNIRWDNRIAFFNGIAATGFIYYHRATGDERVADAAWRVIRRARGMYPEYNGRTLEAIAWAYQRTPEPEWLDFLARTWETTLARQLSWNVMELGAPTIFTVHALPFLARSGLVERPAQPWRLTPAQMDTAQGLHARHLPAGEADLYLEIPAGQPLEMVVIRKGSWTGEGTATLQTPEGRPAWPLAFPRTNALWQRRVLSLPAGESGTYRLSLRSPEAANVRGGSLVTWDVVTSRPVRGVFSTPHYRGLQFVTPRLFAQISGDSPRVELTVAAEGEGFKRAVLYDPAGGVAGSVESFIDLGDRGRYFHKLSSEVPSRLAAGVWSISLEGVTLETMSGLTPYFSTSPQSFFRPDQADSTGAGSPDQHGEGRPPTQ